MTFNLREFDPPITTGGLDLGNAWAHGYHCDDLDEGETYGEQSVLKSSTWSYTVWLKLTGQ
ncbi:unnamed protein product [[Actinomadura] parvosata subsp. kistnae]|uniref:Uncharacterized protein n=1 Tax=[Actinomadura] parvosata subsp. kistnae TaxID=1909395 RepID=A0A1V0AD79_9ACTN|nr:hypothetical protein [Nonomuraea sp. ATCC 55076]AQZ68155.1 hypothetical protein BKM31_47800 [Nonomuraea sp. ATCC 55076]SPL93456.1 unnamed protein product [Actinomadura parvosata subsp. kistnae]